MNDEDGPDSVAAVAADIVACRENPRLVAWREAAAADPPARFAGQRYWARPLPGWGDANARIMIVGLAPAAHGGNRTGRIFTGDRSGDFLFGSLYRTGFANQPTSIAADDGLRLEGVYIGAVNRCAPPGNRPTPEERDRCLPYLGRELTLLRDVRVVVALGSFAWDGVLLAAGATGATTLPRLKPRFGHGAEAMVDRWHLVGSFHPSQQNTFTRKLTPVMLDGVFVRARALAGLAAPAALTGPTGEPR